MEKQEQNSICREIGARTGGDIYIGVVGPVRSGKSTFIKQFMEQLVLPAMSGSAAARERARDELPQSAAGRTIMTTEPKFIPETAVPLQLEGGGACRVRLIDCVGYMVEGAMGHEEDAKPRMVKSPWFEQEVPFDLAAETGTRKVICEHSTIGVVVTTDGSISDIPRAGYAEAEKRVVTELEALGKPYIILLNSTHPDAPETRQLAEGMARDYHRTVLPVSCVDLDAAMLGEILRRVLYEFPVQELDFASPKAPDIINGWCAGKTNNCIPKVLNEIPETARLYLLNALYFKGIWKNQFKKSDTAEEAFTNADGSKSTVHMMNLRDERFNYAENEYFSMAELPYGNEAFSMVVLLPAEGKSLDECLPQLNDERWGEWNSSLSSSALNLKLPRFEMEYDKELIDDMMAMGMQEAFTPSADFSGMADEDLFISLLQQFTYVKVNEEGTEAAAVTVGGMDVAAPGPSTVIPFYVDRPFIFLIKEKSTGVILFMGKVTKL